MSQKPELHHKNTNRLLSALPKKEYQRMLPNMELFSLNFGEPIYEVGDVIRHVYFPINGIVSLLSTVDDKAKLEVGIIGNEGMVGLPVFMGAKTSSNHAVVQGTGNAMKMDVAMFLKECEPGGLLPGLLRRYTHALLTQISQSSACNRFHAIEARLARWLLMTHDRLGENEFQLTQDFLSNMLGVQREGVNKAERELQKQQLIIYSRGNIKILNRVGLEAVACKCYMIIKEEYESFLD